MSTLSLDSIKSYADFKKFVIERPSLDVVNNKDQLIVCFARTLLPKQYLLHGKATLRKEVLEEIKIEPNLHRLQPEKYREERRAFILFCKALLPYIPEDPVDFSPSVEVFKKAHALNIANSMTCEAAIQYACEIGANLEKINLSLFTGKISLASLKELLQKCPNIKVFNLGEKIVESPSSDFDVVSSILALPYIEELVVSNHTISKAGYEAMRDLRSLTILRSNFSDYWAKILGESTTLEKLIIHGDTKRYGGFESEISDAGLLCFEKCNTLKELDISYQKKVTNEAIDRLKTALPDLKITK